MHKSLNYNARVTLDNVFLFILLEINYKISTCCLLDQPSHISSLNYPDYSTLLVILRKVLLISNIFTPVVVAFQDMCSLVCNNQVEAEVIVHSELSDPERAHGESCSKREDSSSTRGLSLSEDGYPHLSQCSPPREEGPPEKLSVAQISSSLPLIKLVSNHNGELEATEGELTADSELQRDTVLTNGFHSPETVRSVLRSEPLENGESRHCPTASGKAVTVGLAPAPFISSGLVHPTSAVHTYLCP